MRAKPDRVYGRGSVTIVKRAPPVVQEPRAARGQRLRVPWPITSNGSRFTITSTS
jgi:hypothetical protein